MKRKLLSMAVALVCSVGAWARVDVTSTYLTDAALDNEETNWGYVYSSGNHTGSTNGYHESWHNTFTLSQTTAVLPAGYYQLSIQVAVEGGTSTTVSLQATSGSNSSTAVYPKYSTNSSYSDMAAWWAADYSHTGNRNLNRIYTTVYVEEGQTLTATFKQTDGSQWIVYGQMELHQLTEREGICAQAFEAIYNPMTNLDMASARYKQRFEDYTGGTVTGQKLTKTITGLPNGKYSVTLNGGASYTSGRGFDGNSGDNLTTFFVNDASTNVTVVNRTDILNGAFEDYTASGGLVTDGSLTLGYNNLAIGANWFVGSVKYIEYLGSCLVNDAVALPEGGAMAANTWYYFDVETAGGYIMTATTLGDIVYTTDGTILTEDAASSVTATFSSPATLSATRYYVMSTSANTLTYTIDSYDLTNEIAAYNAAVTAANTAKTNADAADKVNAAEYTELTTAIANYTGENAIDTEETQNSAMKTALETATSALTSATTAVNTSITAYANAKTYLDAVAPVLETTNVYTAAAYATNYSTPLAAYEAGTLSDADAAALTYGSHVTGNMPALLLSPWSASGTALYINTWSTEGNTDGSGMTTPFFEYWTGDTNTLAANTFTCTLEGLDASALYSIDVLARIKQRNGYAKVANAITLQVGSGTAVDMSTGTHIGTTHFFYDTYTAYGTTDANGTLTVTITVAANSNISWLAFKNMKYARANDATALAKAVAQVTALNGKVPTNIYDTANSVVTANSTPSEEAVSAIVAAANTAAAYVDAYADYLELKDYADALVAVSNNNSTANSTLSSAISTAATNVASVSSVSDVTTVTSTLKTAMITYAGAANPVGDGNKFDLTFMLTDANFDDYIAWENTTVNGVTGWATEQEGGNFQVMENSSTTNGDYHSFMEYWSATAKTNNQFALYNEVKDLPAGTYTINCYALANANGVAGATTSAIYFYANDTQGSLVAADVLTEQNISFVNSSTQDVKIGLKTCTGNQYRWMGIGYVTLYKVPAASDVILDESTAYVEAATAADVVLTKTIYEGFNTVILPFSMTAEEITEVFGEGTLYSFTGADAGTLNFATASALSAHTPYLFKADAAKSISEERISGRTITVSVNNLKTEGTDYNFAGTYTPYDKDADANPITANDYVLGADAAFHPTDGKNAIKAFRAYIQANEATPVKQALWINIDGIATGVNSIDNEQLMMDNAQIYNLAGQRMSKVQQGVNIINGKKVLVK